MRNFYRLALPGVLFLLASCGEGETEAGNSAAGPAANEAALAAPAPAAVPAKPAVALEADGLRLADGRRLAFGAAKDEVVKDLTTAIGKPPTEQSENDECGGGFLDSAGWDGKFYARFDEGKFTGWEDRGLFQTESGLKVGSPRAQVAAITGVAIEESTLGMEFSAGGLGGVLASKAPDAKVTDFWGGATCVAR
jgi:hypothetical protein